VSVFEDSLAPRTRFDWSFHVGDIPVRVHPYFWLSTLLLGLSGCEKQPPQETLTNLALWIPIVFVSILVHELGHVLMGRYFGSRGHIILTGFCGLAVGSAELRERWQRNAVSLAGPGAGFLFAALFAAGCWLYNPGYTLWSLGSLFGIDVTIGQNVEEPTRIVRYIIDTLLWINIFWGLVNLLPIWPLDGGQVSREICEHYRGRDGLRLSLAISLGMAAVLAIFALVEWVRKKPLIPFPSFGGTLFPVIFFGLLAVQSWQLLRFIRLAGPDWDRDEQEPRQPWEQDADWWKHGGRPWDD
jgi:stage IV sporulation protein FB